MFQSRLVFRSATSFLSNKSWQSLFLLGPSISASSTQQTLYLKYCRPSLSTAAEPVNFKVFKDTLKHIPDGEKLKAGDLIEFRQGSSLFLGVVEGQKERRWIVHDENGNECLVRGQDISLQIPGSNYKRVDIGVFKQTVDEGDPELISRVWGSMGETTQPLTLAELAKLVLDGDSPLNIYKAYSLLKQDRKYFKQISRDPPLYFRVSEKEVQTLKDDEEKREKTKKELQEFENAVADALKKPEGSRPDSDYWLNGPHKERIKALKDFAAKDSVSMESRNLALECLRACKLALTPNGAVRLLEAIQIFRHHEPIALHRAGVQTDFDPEIIAAAEEVIENPIADLDESKRRDFTSMRVFSIDDSDTKEIDDALSIENLPDGRQRVWIHVSDPTRWISLDSPLDLEARKRVISLYVPTGPIPIFPWKLSAGVFSLRTRVKTCALSFGAVLTDEGDIESYEVTPSIIIPTSSFNYANAEKLIESKSDPEMVALADLSMLRRNWRKSKGAVNISLPECDVSVRQEGTDDPQISIRKSDADSASKTLIAEFMILAGEIAGRIGRDNSLALPYRSQTAAVLPNNSQLEQLPEGPCRAAALRGRMTRGVTSSTISEPHASLGVDAYVQITSPIRRYTDFLAHLQLKAHLRGDPPTIAQPDLESLLTLVARTTTMRLKAVDASVNYWLAEYFRRYKDEKTWSATLLFWIRKQQGLASVLIDELGLERSMRINKAATPGTKLELRVAAVEVNSGSFRLEEVPRKKSDVTAE